VQVLDGSTDWRHDAACLDEDPELFFPIGKGGPATAQIIKAKAVCAGCSVRVKCLMWAIGGDQELGVWGGLTEDERHRLVRSSRRAGQPLTAIVDPS
jgi:WhiB family redox-sensing transcriptional regulator